MAAFGPLTGFLFVWSQLIIITPTGNAVAALTFADYILQPIYQTCGAPSLLRILVAASAVFIFTTLNCVSVKWVTRVQNFFSTSKIFALLIIICFGIYSFCIGKIINKNFLLFINLIYLYKIFKYIFIEEHFLKSFI